MRKDKTVFDFSLAPLVKAVEMDAVLGHHVSEFGPSCSTHITPRLPSMSDRILLTLLAFTILLILFVKVSSDPLHVLQPLVPTFPCRRTAFSLMRK
jgi:hypothetical protein